MPSQIPDRPDSLEARANGAKTQAISNGASIINDVTSAINAIHDTWEKCVLDSGFS